MLYGYQSPKKAVFVLLTVVPIFLCWSNFQVHAKEDNHGNNSFMKANGSRVKGRNLSDTIYSWQQFETAFAQERKKDSDSEDDIKKCEKMRDKHGRTCTPSSQPSAVPSWSPSVSMQPSISNAPSRFPTQSPSSCPTSSPSDRPTSFPSEFPTHFPTHQPSVAPTAAPTIAFESLVLTRDDGSLWQDNTCQTPLPAGASQPQSEETRFEYFLQLSSGADLASNMQQVEQALATAMAGEVLNCQFNDNSPNFETYGVTSLPVDERSDDKTCADDVQLLGADCYVITGGFTPTIFYMGGGSRRHLGFDRSFSSQSQSEIVDVFGPVLQGILDSDAFVGGDVLSTNYSGFIVSDGKGSGSSGTENSGNENGHTASAIQGDSSGSNNGDDSGTPTGFVAGAIAICLAIIALIVVSAVLLQRRKEARQKQDFELCDEEGGLDLDATVEIDTEALPNKYDTRNIQDGLPECHPGDASTLQLQDAESIRSRSYASGQFGGSNLEDSSVEARRAVSGLKYSVVNDDATFDESVFDLDNSAGNDPHDYTNCKSDTCFKCRSKKLPQPTFVEADLSAIQKDLGSNKKYRPKYSRPYSADDTVDL